MSEEEKPKPVVCDRFEPQAWRKTVCKNCFQHPDVHASGSNQNGVNNKNGVDLKDQRAGSVDKGEKSAASSLKEKYEQLEKDKYRPKEVESHTLPRTKKASGLALITDKYDQLDRLAGKLDSPTKGVPPPTPPKTYKKEKDGGGLAKHKFGSVENVSNDAENTDIKSGLKFKFGSMENISQAHDKRKESVPIPLPKSKDKNTDIASKLDSFQNEVKSGATSKSGQTVIHTQKDGNVDIITIPSKQKDDDKKTQPSDPKANKSLLGDKIDSKSEIPELTSKDDDKMSSSKFGLKSKFDLKSPTPDKEKQPDFKLANDLLSSSKDDTRSKDKSESEDKTLKTGFKKPDLKSAQTDKEKEENKSSSLKDKLNKTSSSTDKEDSKINTPLKRNLEDSKKTDTPTLNDRKTPKLNFKDQLKSPDTDDSPLSKFKDKLKSPTAESDNKQAPSWKDKLKSPVTDNKPDFKLKSELKSPTPEKDKVPEFKLKSQLRSSSEKEPALKNQLDSNKKTDIKGKESIKSQSQDNENKPAMKLRDSLKSKMTDKKSSDDLKNKFDNKKQNSVEDSPTPTNKTFDLRSGLKKATDTATKESETKTTDTKKKAELPFLKSKTDSSISDKNLDSKSKFGAKDEKVPNKLESKFKLGKSGLKQENEDNEKAGSKNKFGLPKLKSVEKSTDDLKPSLKSKFETKEKAEESQNASKSKFEIPALKKVKSPEPEPDIKSVNETKSNKTDDETKKTPTSNLKDTEKDNKGISKINELENHAKETQMPIESSSNKVDIDKLSNKQSANLDSSSRGDFQNNVDKDKKDRHELDTKESNSIIAPDTSDISKKHFESISSDTEVISSDACAVDNTREKSPLHVDTQVFTSSRSKTAGVISLDDKHFDNLDNALGFSGLEFKKSKSGSPGRDKGAKDFLVNGDISTEHEESKYGKEKSNKERNNELKSVREIEELQAELLNMTERCQNLETENEMLRGDLSKKGVTENNLRKQRDEVENAIKGLRTQLKTLEEKCTHLETENINLSNDLKIKHEDNHNKPHTKETEEMDEKLTTKEKIMDDMIEENEQLKQEINELKVEMEEMYDTFRDQEAEEFREMQKELEFTAKNCRILQFKLRKIERRNEQLEQDKNQFEDRLRKLQNSFQDRDAVAHIHSLEDELRLAKEVSVRLHDELDLMEDRRTKIEEENRHLTELLEQADRKQFRLELEVDKLRDKVVELRQELRLREGGPEGEEPRKVSLQLIGKQASLEHEIAELKRELYDGKERELDLKEQLQFLETNNKKIQNKVRDLEDENDNLCKQLKSMSREKAADVESRDQPKTEAEVELKIQLELSEKELKTLKKNLAGIDEENEMLHRELFLLEKRLKEQERQLRVVPRPSSPQAYYEDRIREYEREANEFRSKLLDKENEIEHLHAQMQSLQLSNKRVKDLRKSRSLDLETDYGTVVEVKRQLEIEQQENEVLKEKITNLKEDKHALVEEISVLEERIARGQTTLTALAVAYVDTEDEAKLRTQLRLMEVSQSLLLERIQSLVKHVLSLCEAKISKSRLKQVLETTSSNADGIIESATDTQRDNGTSARVGRPSVTNSNSGNFSELNTFTCSRNLEFPGTTHYSSSDEEVLKYKQCLIKSRDPDKLLCFLEEIYSVLIERLNGMQIEMDSDSVEVVPSDQNGRSDSPEIGMLKSDIKESDPEGINEMSEISEKLVEECNIGTTTTTDSKNDECYPDTKAELDLLSESSLESKNLCDDIKIHSDTVSEEVKAPMTSSHQTSTDDPSVIAQKLEEHDDHRIAFLHEEIDDLRLIIKSKEEKNLLLEEELEELQGYIKKIQADSRRREMELLNEMDLIHGKNEILNNLLEIVKDRAESAEDEVQRLITEINEPFDTPDSEKSTRSSSPDRSIGSDDVFEGSPADKTQIAAFWEEQFKKRIRSLETLLAEERKKSSSLQKKLELNRSDIISCAMSDDVKLHMREKELLQSELQESQKHAVLANDQIRSLTDKLKKVESEKWRSPKLSHKPQSTTSQEEETSCRTCAELQSVKDQLCDELIIFKTKAEELEVKIEEINEIWISKSSSSERERQALEQKLAQKTQECKRLDDQVNKLREEDRMKDIFMKERDNALKEKAVQIARKEELIQEQEDIIRQREEDLQALFDQISQREKTIKELTESLRARDERIKEKDEMLKQLSHNIEEKNEELHYLEEEVHESVLKRKESETMIADLQMKIEETLKVEKSELETENERLQSDVENLMGNIAELHTDKVTLQNELDKAKHALSEAMLMWEKDRCTLGKDLNIAREKMRLYEETAEKKESAALQLLRKEVHSILETREKLTHELRMNKMEHENTVRILNMEKYKLTDELTSKIRMLAHEMNNNDKMSDELTKLRGQDEINYQLHHHEKILRAEYMALKVRYETQLERLQKEHLEMLEVVERLQKEKNLDKEIIVGIQKGMANIRQNYTHDLSRWKDERSVLESHISQIEEGKEIAQHLRAQIDALKGQLTDQEIERNDLVNKMTSERRNWDVERAQLTSKINQLEEQLAVFIQVQSKNKDAQFRMEAAWEKERTEQKRLLNKAHSLAMDLQEQLSRRDEENLRERKNLLEQLEKHRKDYNKEKFSNERMTLEVNTGETKIKHLQKEIEDLKEKQKKEQDFWMREKGDLLRRLAEMRKLHQRDVRRIDDILAALKRLRELASIVIDSDNSAMLPSNGNDVSGTSGDASAASASVPSGDHESGIHDLKQNIDQVILKYIKESLRQIHFLAEELARPSIDPSREERQKLRRSLSSSEIELLKDEFLIGPQESGRILSHHEVLPEVTSQEDDREHIGIQRPIPHDGVTEKPSKPDYIENFLMEQSSFYSDDKDSKIEVHRVKTTRDITRVETQITSLPKPPPSFIIPRSRSTSPAPTAVSKAKHSKPVLKSISLETAHSHRLSAPLTGVSSKSSSTDSSPVGNYSFVQSQNGNGLYGVGALQSGSLDRLSPNTARKKFFESQPGASETFLSWPDRRKRELTSNRNSRSLAGSKELFISESNDDISGNGKLRNSISLDDGAIILEAPAGSGVSEKRSRSAENTSKHSGLRDMFIAMKNRLRPKVKRSQSGREHERVHRLQAVKEYDRIGTSEVKLPPPAKPGAHQGDSELPTSAMSGVHQGGLEEQKLRTSAMSGAHHGDTVEHIEGHSGECSSHITQDQMTPIEIPDDDVQTERKSRKEDSKQGKKGKSRSRSPAEKDSSQHQSTLQRLKKRFRSKSVDRARDHPDQHVTPILVGHVTTAQEVDPSLQQYSETCV